MADNSSREPMLDMFIFEANQLIGQFEQAILESENNGFFSATYINEIFRIMHTVKGSSAMMRYTGISTLAHSVEDVFYYIRELKPENIDYSRLFDLLYKSIDFIKSEIARIEDDETVNTDSSFLVAETKEFLSILKNESNLSQRPKGIDCEQVPEKQIITDSDSIGAIEYSKLYEARITFAHDCEMVNVRAFSLLHNLKDHAEIVEHFPANIMEEESAEIIDKEGFSVIFKTDLDMDKASEIINKTSYIKDIEVSEIQEKGKQKPKKIDLEDMNPEQQLLKSDEPDKGAFVSAKQNYISVNIQKMDMLMDLVGELVISEAMVTRNPEVAKLEIDSFQKASAHHRKIISELQDMVMSVRMVPLSATFQKMNRIIRDMSKKLQKEVKLEIVGEETEVDKNIIENISDPIMHLIRNSIDHGLETPEERRNSGKCETGKIVLEAKNAGSDVIISVRDDGRGLDKAGIYEKAYANGLTNKRIDELTEKEILSFIFLPGFSTKQTVTEFSGRGVGMDVVVKNIEKIGGIVEISSEKNMGTTINIKIPLTLAIIDGMIVTVGNSSYIIPIIAIRESFRPKENEIINDPDGNEMILIRGKCYPVVRLHKRFGIKTDITSLSDGIMIMVENEDCSACIFVDALVGEQQVVVKAMPVYIKKIKGLAGCTLLGDGSISLIIDVDVLISNRKER